MGNFCLHSFILLFVSATLSNVLQFSVTIFDMEYAASESTIRVTLWFNSTIYQHNITMPERATAYTAHLKSSPRYSILSSSDCPETQNNHNNHAKMMIENDIDDAVMIDKVSFTITSNTWYGIDSFCIPQIYDPKYPWNEWSIPDSQCSDAQQHLTVICINNAHCKPYQQIIYFDLSKPNQYISGAAWNDGTNESLHLTTCGPTTASTTTTTTTASTTTASTTTTTTNTTTTASTTASTTTASTTTTTVTTTTTAFPRHKPFFTELGEYITLYHLFVTVIVLVLLGICFCVGVGFLYKSNDSVDRETDFEQWFKRSLRLPQYLEVFREYGYYNLNILQQIDGKETLEAMGIISTEHQALIMQEIESLRNKTEIELKQRSDDFVFSELVNEDPKLMQKESDSEYVDWNPKSMGSESVIVIRATRVEGIELQHDAFIVENEKEQQTLNDPN